MTRIWTSRTIGAVLIGLIASTASPASACSCVPAADLEWEGRAALARADVIAELMVDRGPMATSRHCRADRRARFWFRPGMRVDRDHSARVLRIMKGRSPRSVRLRDNPTESVNGYCSVRMNSCQIGIQPGRTGPMLLTRIAADVFKPMDVCTQAVFTDWYARRRAARPKAK